MAAIGQFPVTTWAGDRPEHPVLQVATLEPWPGVDGVALAVGAYQSREISCLTSVKVSGISAADLLEINYKSLISTSITVVDTMGRSWPTVVVKSVNCVTDYDKADGQHRVSAAWLLIFPSAKPTPKT
jgi:hypothetical protein